jgi:hypothetical protein
MLATVLDNPPPHDPLSNWGLYREIISEYSSELHGYSQWVRDLGEGPTVHNGRHDSINSYFLVKNREFLTTVPFSAWHFFWDNICGYLNEIKTDNYLA